MAENSPEPTAHFQQMQLTTVRGTQSAVWMCGVPVVQRSSTVCFPNSNKYTHNSEGETRHQHSRVPLDSEDMMPKNQPALFWFHSVNIRIIFKRMMQIIYTKPFSVKPIKAKTMDYIHYWERKTSCHQRKELAVVQASQNTHQMSHNFHVFF